MTTFCFVASYAVALALEVSRLWFRSGVRGAVMLAFAAAGLFAHTLFLYQRAATARALPLSNAFDWFLLAAWLLVGAYFYLVYYHPHAAIGLFVWPLVLCLVGAAQLADRRPFQQTEAAQAWARIHGVFLLIGVVAVSLGFVAGMMYLIQAYRLKRKLPAVQGFRFPSLEWLERTNSRAMVVSALMIGVGFLAGVVLNAVRQELPWSDPTIWVAGVMLLWLIAATVFTAVYKPARQGRKVAYLTVASFVFLVFTLCVLLFFDTAHGGGSTARRAALRSHRPGART